MRIRHPTQRLVLALALVALAALIAQQAGLFQRRPAGHAARLYPSRAVVMLRQRPDTVILDLRAPLDYRAGHLPGAVSLDYNSPYFSTTLKGMDRDDTYLLYDATDVLSRKAARHMAELGFTDVHDIAGGFRNWKSQHLPVATGE